MCSTESYGHVYGRAGLHTAVPVLECRNERRHSLPAMCSVLCAAHFLSAQEWIAWIVQTGMGKRHGVPGTELYTDAITGPSGDDRRHQMHCLRAGVFGNSRKGARNRCVGQSRDNREARLASEQARAARTLPCMEPTAGNLNAINLMNWAIIPIMGLVVVWRFLVRPRIVVRHVRQRYAPPGKIFVAAFFGLWLAGLR